MQEFRDIVARMREGELAVENAMDASGVPSWCSSLRALHSGPSCLEDHFHRVHGGVDCLQNKIGCEAAKLVGASSHLGTCTENHVAGELLSSK